jgi:hypothetical protein
MDPSSTILPKQMSESKNLVGEATTVLWSGRLLQGCFFAILPPLCLLLELFEFVTMVVSFVCFLHFNIVIELSFLISQVTRATVVVGMATKTIETRALAKAASRDALSSSPLVGSTERTLEATDLGDIPDSSEFVLE